MADDSTSLAQLNEPADAPSSTEMVMPLVTAVEASPSSWETYGPSPAAVLSALSREAPAPRATPTEDGGPLEADVAEVGGEFDAAPTPIIDRSQTDTASLLRELSGLFSTEDSEPPRPAPAPAKPPPPPPPKKKKGLFGRG